MPAGAAGRAAGSERAGNLPLPLTSFVGREEDLAQLGRLLDGFDTGGVAAGEAVRLVTLTGPGGVGKTRLALEAAEAVASEYPQGVWLVDLGPLADPALVPAAVAGVLGVHEVPGRPLASTLAERLGRRRLLLLLDNCEHVVEAAAEIAEGLLRACPQLRVLATSRELLGATGEAPIRVPPLAAPPQSDLPLARLNDYDAVRLFVARVGRVRPTFSLSAANGGHIAEVCRRLDGLPLAIELAAARVRILSVEQVAGRLDDRFGLLTAGSRTAPRRQQTLRAAVGWSYDLLSPPEQRLFRRLSVFAGGWTLAAAEEVGTGEGVQTQDVLDLLARLADRSLIVVDEAPGQEVRYRLLETLREYGGDRLRDAGESEAAYQRHAACFLALAERAAVELEGRRQVAWLDRLQAEQANLRQAMRWWESRGATEEGLRMGAALRQYWFLRGDPGEGRELLGAFLARPAPAVPGRLRAEALWGAATLAYLQGDHEAVRGLAEESLALARGLGDQLGCARANFMLTMLALRVGDPAARDIAEEAVACARAAGDPHTMGKALARLGVAVRRSAPARSRAALEESLRLFREVGDAWGCSVALSALAGVALDGGDRTAARRCYDEALSIRRKVGDRHGIAIALHNLGVLAEVEGDTPQAAVLFREGLALSRDVGDRHSIPWILAGLARTAASGHPAHAARILGAVTPHLAPGATGLHPPDVPSRDRALATLRRALGGPALTAALAEGASLTLEQAAEEVGGLACDVPAARAGTAAAGGLTPREREVAALVARGFSNRQIATELTIAERTAENHVEHILGKLGLHSRAQVAAWVVRRDSGAAEPAAPPEPAGPPRATGSESG